MKCTYDKEADAAYIYVKYPIKAGEAKKQMVLEERFILDFDDKGKLLGVEVLEARKTLDKQLLARAKQLA